MKKLGKTLIASAFLGILAPVCALAQPLVVTVKPTATVVNNCVLVTPPSVAFAAYDPTSTTPAVVNTSLSVDCTKGDTVSVDLPAGGQNTNLTNSTNGQTLTLAWNAPSASQQSASVTTPLSFPLSATAAAQQDVSAGTYTGSAVVDVNF